jgi:uncharacterized membrane protein
MRITVLIHLLGVIVWVGGMFFAHVCLRPVAAAQLAPPQRLPLLAAILGRFFTAVAVSAVAILGTGVIRLADLNGAPAPWHWHAMSGIASAMIVIFLIIVLRFYPRLKTAVTAQNWPQGGAAMDVIRKLVLVNLLLGLVTVIIARVGA